jgi:hypothetical protein
LAATRASWASRITSFSGPIRARFGGSFRFGPYRFDFKEKIQTEIFKQFHIPRADIERAKRSLAEFAEILGNAGQRPHEGGIHMLAGGQIDNEFPIAPLNHRVNEFLQGTTSLKVPTPFNAYPDLSIETGYAYRN